jgi:REG-2-like HAD superfamily hydrolase
MTPNNTTRFRAIFFDAGFTLIYSEPSVAVRCAEVAAAHGIALTAAQIEPVLPQAEAFFQQSMREEPDIWASDEAIVRFWKRYYANLFAVVGLEPGPLLEEMGDALYHLFNEPGAWVLYSDVLPTIQALHAQGYVLGVISDWGNRLAHRILLPLGLGKYFDFMVVSATVRTAKPSSALYTEALRRAGVAPHEALHIGDNYVLDVLGARGTGITPVLLDRHGRAGGVDCWKVESLAELPPLVATLEGRVPVEGHPL